MTDSVPPTRSVVPAPEIPPKQSTRQRSLTDRLFAPSNRLTWLAASALMIALVLWISFTPSGILGKADAIGYAVCHRITVRSFAFPNGQQLPMCARCTGTFIGVLVGLLVPGLLYRRRRAGQFPIKPVVISMIAVSAYWAFDGANSFTLLLPGHVPHLYEPTNFLRLVTGMFHGITMGSLILPVANATLWEDVTPEPTLDNYWQYLGLMGIGVVLIAMVLSGWAIFLYPLAIVSAVGAMSILAAVNTVVMTTLLKYENRSRTLRDAMPVILFGFAVTISMIGVIDALRYALFQTWGGFQF